MAEQVYKNPQTGERIVFRNGQWVPASPLQGVPGSSTQRPTSAIIGDNLARTFANNVMALPSATGDLLAGAAGLAKTAVETPFADGGFLQRLQANTQSQQQQFPANLLRAIPRPTVEGITSTLRAAPALMPGGESPKDAYNRAMTATTDAQALEQQQRPGATMVGDIGGDVLTLAVGRQPFAKGLVENARGIPSITNKVTRDALETIAREQPELVPQIAEIIGSSRLAAPGAQRMYRRMVESGPVSSIIRGLGKGAEASLEGAVMAAIHENDPIVNAGLAGGGQLALSLSGTLLGVPTSMKQLALKAGGLFALFRVGQEFLPGDNSTYTATDSAFNKIAMALTLGATSQVLGGRFRGSEVVGRKFAEDMPRLADIINTIPRGALISLINRVQEEEANGESMTLNALDVLSRNPSLFPQHLRNRLERSLNNNSFPDEVKRLRDNEIFTSILDKARLPEAQK